MKAIAGKVKMEDVGELIPEYHRVIVQECVARKFLSLLGRRTDWYGFDCIEAGSTHDTDR